jgi:hypothetical protein
MDAAESAAIPALPAVRADEVEDHEGPINVEAEIPGAV